MSINETLKLMEQSTARKVRSRFSLIIKFWKKKSTLSITITVIAIVIAGGVGYVLFCKGTPAARLLTSHNIALLIPELSNSPQSIDPPELGSDIYSRAKEARRMDANERMNIGSRPQVIAHYKGPSLIVRPKDIKIPPGTVAKARLTTGAGNGRIQAVLLEAVRFQGETLIEQGSTILGQGSSTEDRLMIQFNRLISRDGAVEKISAEGADLSDKTAGLKGSLVSSRGTKLAAAIGLNFISGASAALQDSEGQFGATIHPPNLKDAALQGTAQASLDQSREMMDEMKNTKVEIRVPEGTELYIFFNGEN